jgi:hypothetical protein
MARIVLLTTCAALAWLAFALSQPAPTGASPPTPAHPVAGFQGTASCSGRACHGAVGGDGPHRREYTLWALHDPHRDAYDVLLTERSRQMLKNLVGNDHPEAHALCLACHGQSAAVGTPRAANGFACESCHGAAEKWLGPHTTWGKETNERDKEAIGFRSMKSPVECARTCVECHVGSPRAEVNHDLIAAGHPRLNFELTSYVRRLPAHWRPDRSPMRDPARTWAVGQTVSTEAALQLLAHRASPAGKAPWPEFAESNCFACHHDLRADASRPSRGLLPFNDWYYAGSKSLDKPFREDFDRLRAAMEKPLPDRDAVGRTAALMRKWLEQNADKSSLTPGAWLKERPTVPANWDVAAQLTLAFQAEYDARVARDKSAVNPRIEEAILRLHELLRFNRGGGNFDSPAAFDAEEFARRLNQAMELLGPRAGERGQ